MRRFKPLTPLFYLFVIATALVSLLLQFPTVRLLLIRAKGEPANLLVDTQAVLGQLPRPWRNLAQGGEDPQFQLTPLQSQLTPLHPQYIRLDHIYDFYVSVPAASGNLTFDWTKLDQILSQITSLGAKPFLSLSYMPASISRGDITDTPQNWPDWALVVQRTIEHVSGSAGLNLADVYYEIWNEPDLFGHWKTYGDKNYLTLYTTAVQGAARAANVQPFKLGGPATTAFYEAWANNLFKFVTDNNLRLDFFSWHRYNRDIDQYLQDIAKLNLVLEKYPNLFNIEKIITESGHDSNIDADFDTYYGATHLLSLSRASVGLIDRVFTFEIQDGKDPQGQAHWGRWGLFTHPDFGSTPKPRLKALSFLEQLGSDRLSVIGEGSWVTALAATTEDTSQTQVLIVNYDPQKKHSEQVPLTFINLPVQSPPALKSFSLTETFLTGNRRQLNLATTSAELKHAFFMPANSAALITLTPSP